MSVLKTTWNSLIFIKCCKMHNKNLPAAVREMNEPSPHARSPVSRICESNSSWLESQQTEDKSATQRKIYLVHISEILFLEAMLANSVYDTLSRRRMYVGEHPRD
jgi:hypothetical protein